MSVGHKCDGGSVPGDDRSADSEAPSPDGGDTQAAGEWRGLKLRKRMWL